MQVAANKQMADYEQELGLKMWKDTNYPAQVEMMKAAGLNPAAVLSNGGGGSGATGASAAGVGGGQAANAAQTQANQNELGLQMAQMQLVQAQTEKTKAEAENIAGEERNKLAAEVESLSQGVKNLKAKEELDRAQTSLVNLNRDILTATKDDAVKMVQEGAREAFHGANIAANQEYVNTQTTKTRIDTITAELNTALINNEATRVGINLTKAESKRVINKKAEG